MKWWQKIHFLCKYSGKNVVDKDENLEIESKNFSYRGYFKDFLCEYSKKPSSKFNKRLSSVGGFSMLELLFVLVIIGILASLALPRISFSRNNALSIAIQSDIQTIISSVQEYAITNEFLTQNANPQWLVSYLRLSPQRWVINGDSLKIGNNGVLDSQNDCLSIKFNQANALQILFNRNNNSSLCQNLLKNYADDIIVPLNIAP